MSNYINSFYSTTNNLSNINATTLNTSVVSNVEFNTLDGIDTSQTIQNQLNTISANSANNVNMTGITYNPTYDITTIDNNVQINKSLTVNNSAFDSTSIEISQAVPYLSSNTQTISNASNGFQNGSYTADASSFVNSTQPYNAFDNSLTSTFWRSSYSYPQTNTATCGQYNGTVNTVDILSNTAYYGDYIQISLPYSFVIGSYSINASNSSNNMLVLPNIIDLFGSLDGTHWYLINHKTGITSNQTINFDNNRNYSYFRFVIEKTNMTQGTSTTFYTEIGNLNLMGVINKLTITSKSISLTGYTTTDSDLEIPSSNKFFLNGSLVCNYTVISPTVMSYLYGLNANAQGQLNNKLNSIVIGTVSTLNAGSQCFVSATNNNNVCTLNFGIAKGDKGDQGTASNVAVVMSSVIAGVVGVGVMGVLVASLMEGKLLDLFGSLIDAITGESHSLSAEQQLEQQLNAIYRKLDQLDARCTALEDITQYMTTPDLYTTKLTSKLLIGSVISLNNTTGNIDAGGNLNMGSNITSGGNVKLNNNLLIGSDTTSTGTYLKCSYSPDTGIGIYNNNGYGLISSKRSGLFFGEQSIMKLYDDGSVEVMGNFKCNGNLLVNGNLRVAGDTSLTNLTVSGNTNIRAFNNPNDGNDHDIIELHGLFDQLIDGFEQFI